MLRVVDPHIHFIAFGQLRYPWLQPPTVNYCGDTTPIARYHGPAEFLANAGDIEILKVVHVEAGHDPAAPLDEALWLQQLADAPDGQGMPQGIVAYADLTAPDVGELLARLAALRNMRGIRQILNLHPDPAYNFVERDYMNEASWRAGFALLERHGLSFDMHLYPHQMADAAALARTHPGTQLILDHTGMFADRGSVAGWRQWRDGLRGLAACPNVAIKLSGLGMLDHRWTVESIRPYVLEAIDAFGPERAMFASNFPVDRLYSSYSAVWTAFAETVRDATAAETDLLFRRTAERVYRI